MKKEFAGLIVAALLAPMGCTDSTPGGPGVSAPNSSNSSQTANRPSYGEEARTFDLNVPMLPTSLKQGETKSAKISLNRGKNFDEDVSITLNDIPKGVTVEPAAPKILHGDKEVTLQLTAAHDAALGDFTINVVGHPTTGADARSTMKVTVAKD